MCLSRRELLLAGAAGVAGAVLTGGPAGAGAPTSFPTTPFGAVDVIPRSAWGSHLPVTGKLEPETVKFLLVHHSASPNGYGEGEVVRYLSSFHKLHTSAEKGWPDLAYNFFVDRFGRIFEGRTGSLKGPVMASATGGNQGFAQLACLVGDFTKEPPTAEALSSLNALLAALAARDGVSLADGAEVSFVSRGSNKHRKGVTVTTPTIAGHRDMSLTECPGDACYALIGTKIVPGARGAGSKTVVTGPPTTDPPAMAPPTNGEPAVVPSTSAPASTPSTEVTEVAAGPPAPRIIVRDEASQGRPLWPVAGAGGVTVAAVAGFLVRRRILLQRAEASSFTVRATEHEP